MLLCYSNTFAGVIKRVGVDANSQQVNGKRRGNSRELSHTLEIV